jgi:hypothetical protein
MFRKIVDELGRISSSVNVLTEAVHVSLEALQEGSGVATDPATIVELQRQISALEGTIAAGLKKSEATFAAARASEERERGHARRAEAHETFIRGREESEDGDSFESIARSYAGLVPESDGASGEGLPAVQTGLDLNGESKQTARTLKRGRR